MAPATKKKLTSTTRSKRTKGPPEWSHVHNPRPIPPPLKLGGGIYAHAKALFSQNLPPSEPPSEILPPPEVQPSSETPLSEITTPPAVTEHFSLLSREVAHRRSNTAQPEWAHSLEQSEAASARLITGRYIARDMNDEPIVGYFPGSISGRIIKDTHHALKTFGRGYMRKKEHDPDEKKSKDHRHPTLSGWAAQFWIHALLHLGCWLAQAHPGTVFDPVFSADFHGPSAANFSHSAKLFQELEPLTTEISMLFAAFYFRAWARARRVFNVLCEYLPGATALTRTSPWEAWTHRALLFNLNTHIHRDLNDDVHGFAAITVFGSFTGGNFVIPELRIKFPFQPGDVIFLKGQMLAHFVTPWEKKGEDGERFSIVHFNHQKVADWVNRKNPEGQEGLDTPEIGVWSEEV